MKGRFLYSTCMSDSSVFFSATVRQSANSIDSSNSRAMRVNHVNLSLLAGCNPILMSLLFYSFHSPGRLAGVAQLKLQAPDIVVESVLVERATEDVSLISSLPLSAIQPKP